MRLQLFKRVTLVQSSVPNKKCLSRQQQQQQRQQSGHLTLRNIKFLQALGYRVNSKSIEKKKKNVRGNGAV